MRVSVWALDPVDSCDAVAAPSGVEREVVVVVVVLAEVETLQCSVKEDVGARVSSAWHACFLFLPSHLPA